MRKRQYMGAILLGIMVSVAAGCSSSADKSNREGMEKYQSGNYMEASRLFAQAISQDNDEPEYYVNQGMADIQLHQCKKAKENFQRALELENDSVMAYRGMGLACLTSGDYDEAIEYFNLAIANADRTVGKLDYDLIGYRAEAEMEAGRYDDAILSYTQLIDLNVDPMGHYIKRGIVYATRNQMEQALSDFQAAIAEDSDNYTLYLEIYQSLKRTGDEEDGIDFLNQALSIESEKSEELAMRGQILVLLGRQEEAVELFQRAASDGCEEASFMLARCYEDMGKYGDAEMLYQTLLAKNKESATVYNQLAICKMKQGDYEKALTMIDQGISMEDPKALCDLYWNEAMVYEAQRDYIRAYDKVKEYGERFAFLEDTKKELDFLRTR